MDEPSRISNRVFAWARAAKRDVLALWLARRDPRVPWPAKLLAALVAAYALSPIDLIPDFIPVLGQLDDLILIPLGIVLAVRLIPDDVLEELRGRAATSVRPRPLLGVTLIAATWVAVVLGSAALWSEHL